MAVSYGYTLNHLTKILFLFIISSFSLLEEISGIIYLSIYM